MMNPNRLSLDIQTHLPPISPPCRSPLEGNIPTARYNKLSEMLRKTTNSQLQCSMFCGGRKCKYESAHNWSSSEKAIPALYSHWITDEILAMARPNNEIIAQGNLIELFKNNCIKTIINLQERGEHANCGPSLDSSGFAYDPKLFMDKQIYFYNFQWKDYSGVGESPLLDMVKVVSFALSQGKIAIHCHAGLGRTGVLIAGYLIFAYRCQAHSAIKFVRMRRPNSIQSRGQILSLFKFANYISPCFIVYKSISTNLNDFLQRQRILLHGQELRCLRYIPKILFIICEKLIQLSGKKSILNEYHEDEYSFDANFTRHYLSNQSDLLPKLIIEDNQLESEEDYSNQTDFDSVDTFDPDCNLQYEIDDYSKELDDDKLDPNLEIEDNLLIDSLANTDDNVEQFLDEVAFLNAEAMSKHRPSFEVLHQSLLNSDIKTVPPEVIVTVMTSQPNSDPGFSSSIYNYQKAINNTPTGWEKLYEADLETLSFLFWSWFENLDSPILNNDTVTLITENRSDVVNKAFFGLHPETRYTLEYLVRFVVRLCEAHPEEDRGRLVTRLVTRLVAAFTTKRVQLVKSDNQSDHQSDNPSGKAIPIEVINDLTPFDTNCSRLIHYTFPQKQNWLVMSDQNRDAIFHLFDSIMILVSNNTNSN